MLNGVIYLQDLNSNVYAIDRSSGKLVWRHTFNKPSVVPNGVAYGWGRVYGATVTNAFALDAKSGRLLWSRKLNRSKNDGIDIAPQLCTPECRVNPPDGEAALVAREDERLAPMRCST